MSLNGLDAAEILQAHQESLAEPGGWFLTRYISRDEVELLSRGAGGLSETTIALAAYPDASPLYGFLHYRRRKVLLKYIPPDTSRLLLARSGVHFQAFADQFAHDAQFTASAPHDLSDTALSAVCPPHAATSTSLHSLASSSKRQNLDEIFEDAEEAPRPQIPTQADPVPSSVEIQLPDTSRLSTERSIVADPPTEPHLPLEVQDEHVLPQTLGNAENTFSIPAYRPEDSPRHSLDEWNKSPLFESRPATSDSFRYEYDSWKPKEKARPRPVADAQVKKTSVATPTRATLPAGMRISSKRVDERPRSSRSQRSVRRPANGDADTVPPVPTNLETFGPTSTADIDSRSEDIVAASFPKPESDLGPSNPAWTMSLDGQMDDPAPITASNLQQNGATDGRQVGAASANQVEAAAVKQKPAPISLEKQRLLKALKIRSNKAAAKANSAATSEVASDSKDAKDADNGTVSAYHSTDDFVRPVEKAEVVTAIEKEPESVPAPAEAGADEKAPPKKRREITSIRTERTISSDSGFQSDDSLLDELHTAQVQDATPVEVPSSPRTPTLSGFGKIAAVTPIHIKKSPQSSSKQQISPGLNRSGRVSSMSQTSQETLSLSKNRNVSSGISRRIQALADNSSREPSPGGQTRVESGPEVARSFLTIRNLASRPSSRGNAYATGKGSQASRASSPSRSVAARSMNYFRTQQPIAEERARTSHGAPSVTGSIAESTMTARILQSADGAGKKLTPTPVTMAQSEPRASSAMERPGSAASISSRHSSRTLLSKQSVETGWNFIKRSGRRPETSRSPPPTQRSMSSTSLERVDEDAGVVEEKSSSRASRLLKRMSGLSSSSRNKDNASERQSRSSMSKDKRRLSAPPAGFSLGDINVQFPDTLLWKRRWVEVDSFGNLVLGAAAGERTRGAKKQFHLREFRPALAPSQERQELPHSIMLDFHTGGTLQLAFEDPIGQTTILRKLLDTQSGWIAHE